MNILAILFVFFLVLWNEVKKQDIKTKSIIQKKQEKDSEIVQTFIPTKKIYDDTYMLDYAIYINEQSKKILFVNFSKEEQASYYFSELIECSIVEDGTTIESGGVGRAIAGGVLAGGVGAIVGATTRSSKPTSLSLSVRIVTKNINNPLYTIPIITESTKRTTNIYKQKKNLAEEIYATMLSIIKNN